jgi:hypothetical protein
MADPIRDAAAAHPHRNRYGLYNLLISVSAHNARDFGEQVQAMQRAGEQAEPGHHARYCPTCRRSATGGRPLLPGTR